jgi:hypothetical protein
LLPPSIDLPTVPALPLTQIMSSFTTLMPRMDVLTPLVSSATCWAGRAAEKMTAQTRKRKRYSIMEFWSNEYRTFSLLYRQMPILRRSFALMQKNQKIKAAEKKIKFIAFRYKERSL